LNDFQFAIITGLHIEQGLMLISKSNPKLDLKLCGRSHDMRIIAYPAVDDMYIVYGPPARPLLSQ